MPLSHVENDNVPSSSSLGSFKPSALIHSVSNLGQRRQEQEADAWLGWCIFSMLRTLEDPHVDFNTKPPASGITSRSSPISSRQTVRYVTAADAAAHALDTEPALTRALAELRYEGLYRVQAGFNQVMFEERLLVQEIHLSLENNFQAQFRADVPRILGNIFAPFPTVIDTPGETIQISVEPGPSTSSLMRNVSNGFQQPVGTVLNLNGEGLSRLHVKTEDQDEGGDRKGEESWGRKKKDWSDKDRSGSGGGGDGSESGPGSSETGQPNTIQVGRRVLNVPTFGPTLTIKGSKGSHQVKTVGGINIVVSNNAVMAFVILNKAVLNHIRRPT
jgi:hypothetical protein